MYRLASCGAIVTTESSTFGRCSAALGGRPVLEVSTDGACSSFKAPDPVDVGMIPSNLANRVTPYSEFSYVCKDDPGPKALCLHFRKADSFRYL